MATPRKIAFVWNNFTEYHLDRIRAAQQAMPGHQIFGIEIARSVSDYDWARPDCDGVQVQTLFDRPYETVSPWSRVSGLVRCVLRQRPDVLFTCHYEAPEVIAAAAVQTLSGRRSVIMNDSRWVDRPRRLPRELAKIPVMMLFGYGLASGPAASRYFEHYGLSPERIKTGYDTVSVDRLRRQAGEAGAQVSFAERPIVAISRLLPKKNLFRLLDAYALYRSRCPHPRPLEILGNGELEASLRAKIAQEGIIGVSLPGFVGQEDVARRLSRALCLVLFSTVDQWGLAVNEAIALNIPVLASTGAGSTEALVRNGINGAAIEPDNVEGLAQLLTRLSSDPALWQAWSQGCAAFHAEADCAHFGRSAADIALA